MNREPRQLNFLEEMNMGSFLDHLKALREKPDPTSKSEEITVELADAPSHADLFSLRSTLDRPVEYALFCHAGKWSLTKGQDSMVNSILPKLEELIPGDLYIHTHPYLPSEGPFDFSLPSYVDVSNEMELPPYVLSGILSGAGITIHSSREFRPQTPEEILDFQKRFKVRLNSEGIRFDSATYHHDLLEIYKEISYLDFHNFSWGTETETLLSWYVNRDYLVQKTFRPVKSSPYSDEFFWPDPPKMPLTPFRPILRKE